MTHFTLIILLQISLMQKDIIPLFIEKSTTMDMATTFTMATMATTNIQSILANQIQYWASYFL